MADIAIVGFFEPSLIIILFSSFFGFEIVFNETFSFSFSLSMGISTFSMFEIIFCGGVFKASLLIIFSSFLAFELVFNKESSLSFSLLIIISLFCICMFEIVFC